MVWPSNLRVAESFVKLITVVLSFNASVAATNTNADSDDASMAQKVNRSTVIVSGRIVLAAAGGGAATVTVAVEQIFKAPKEFKPVKEITFGCTAVSDNYLYAVSATDRTNLFFLRNMGSEGLWADEFFEATEGNARALRSALGFSKSGTAQATRSTWLFAAGVVLALLSGVAAVWIRVRSTSVRQQSIL